MNILITDDEKPARERLNSLIEKLPGCHTVGQAENGIEAVYKSFNLNIDVVLMDIHLPKMSGIEAAQHINTADSPPAIVFVTSFIEHTLEAFSVHSAGYLLKPICLEDLEDTLSHIQRNRWSKVAEPMADIRHDQRFISNSHSGEIKLIPVNKIYYLKSHRKYTHIHYDCGAIYSPKPLKYFETAYPEMMRIHRGILINKNYLRKLEKNHLTGFYQVHLHGVPASLPVSRRNLTPLRRFIKTFMQPTKAILKREQQLREQQLHKQQ